ncbi:MAG: TolC family protein, partial [Bacteroidota bacterium]
LLQGLITDERRTTLRRAELLGDWNEIEAEAVLNDLVYEATLAYLEWAYSNREVQILTEGIELATDRLAQTKESYFAGDKPALDTLETNITLRQRQADLQAAQGRLLAARTFINQFLWPDSGLEPVNLALDLTPEPPLAVDRLPFGVSIADNPTLRAYNFKIQDLQLERRLKTQKTLPKLSLKYEFLAEGFDFSPGTTEDGTSIGDFILQDNKWTLSFSTPIFMRSARGDLQLNAIKQQRTELDRNQKAGELELKLRQYQGQVTFLTDQLVISRQIVNDYQSLLEAEQIKFNLGESSVFLLNSRENKLLEARLKLVKQEADLAKAMAGRRWVTGGN